MPWLLRLCVWHHRLQLLQPFNCQANVHVLTAWFKSSNFGLPRTCLTKPTHDTCRKKKNFKCLGGDQGEKESWNRLVNTIPQALVVTGCHFKACSCIQEREKRRLQFLTVSDFYTWGVLSWFFFFFLAPSLVNKSGRNFAPQR